MEIIQGKTSISEASRAFDVSPAEIEEWVDEAKGGMENALRAKPLDIKEQYERQLKELQEEYGEAMLELRARKKYQNLLNKRTRNDPWDTAGFEIRRHQSNDQSVVPVGLKCLDSRRITNPAKHRPRFKSALKRPSSKP